MPERISREEHALRHGPTAGDRIRLGDTDLWIRIERDLTEPADQALWGYAKNFRSRMSQHDRATSESELDAVIGGAVVVDPMLGVVKADIGIKDGRVVGIGRAGNPDITDGVDLTIGPGTWPIPCHGLIVTPGAIDSHVHLLSPRLVPVALSAGVTTLITAGFEEPAWRMLRTFEAFERLPDEPRPAGLGPHRRRGVRRGHDRGGRDRVEGPRGLGRVRADDRRRADHGRGVRRRRLPAHRRPERIGRAGGDGRGDRGPDDPRVPRRGRGRRAHPRPDRHRPRTERHLLLDDARPPVRARDRGGARRHDPHRPRGQPAARRGRRRGARADPPGDHGRRGTAARPGRDLDHQQRLAGDGPDRRDHPPHVAARARDERVARVGGGIRLAERARRRQRAGAALPGQVHGGARPRPRRRCGGRVARRPVTWPTWSCGIPHRSARSRWR